jgi:hypothetical protein
VTKIDVKNRQIDVEIGNLFNKWGENKNGKD